MFIQYDGYACGAVSFSNAVKALGGDIDVESAKSLAGTTYKHGTSRQGIIRGLQSLGYKATPYHSRNPDNAWKWIKRHAPSCPIIALVDSQEHWLVLSGILGDKVIVVDGSPKEWENGVDAMGKQNVLERLNHLGHYYAIRVSKS